MTIEKAEDQLSRGTPRGEEGLRSRDEAQVVVVRSLPMMFTSDIYCRLLTCDKRELISW